MLDDPGVGDERADRKGRSKLTAAEGGRWALYMVFDRGLSTGRWCPVTYIDDKISGLLVGTTVGCFLQAARSIGPLCREIFFISCLIFVHGTLAMGVDPLSALFWKKWQKSASTEEISPAGLIFWPLNAKSLDARNHCEEISWVCRDLLRVRNGCFVAISACNPALASHKIRCTDKGWILDCWSQTFAQPRYRPCKE